MPAQLPSLTTLEPRMREWLLANQDPAGGWAEHPGARLSVLNTAEVVLSLTSAGVKAGDPQIQRAVEFINGEQRAIEPPDRGCWTRTIATGAGGSREVPDIIRTCLAVRALVSGGEVPEKSQARAGIDWLIGRQNQDHGWGYQRDQQSAILPTAFALIALIRTAETAATNPWRETVTRGLEFLTRLRNRSGSFGTAPLEAVHTIHAALVLQAARECEFSVHPSAERDAIAWLLRHPDDAMSVVEETITIDPQHHGNYGFLFAADALLLVVLGRSTIADHRKTQLWGTVQRSVTSRFDENSGGLYGQRVFSWSTAHGLYAITLTGRELTQIPASPPEDPTGLKVGGFILLFAVILVLTLLYLSSREEFTVLHATFLGFLMLACLVAYGKVGEKTFQQLVSQLLKRGDKDE
jgi:hypothetical protein